MLDIIIPAYNAHKTLPLTLSSIATQTYVDKIKVTVVNDCGDNYNEIVNYYKQFMDIQETTTDKNGGVGVARQKGIDITRHKFFMCLDADDTLMDNLSIEKMLNKIESQHVVLSGGFLEELENRKFKRHLNDFVWMHAKVYRRSFIDKHKIRFNETRANEDMGFNMYVRLLAQERQICYYNDFFVLWRFNHKSHTRKDNNAYKYHEGALGVMENKQQVLEAMGIEKDRHRLEAVSAFIDFHFMVQETDVFRPEQQDWVSDLFNRTKKFYHDIAKHAIAKTNTDDIKYLYRERFNMFDFMPTTTLFEFIDMMEEKDESI